MLTANELGVRLLEAFVCAVCYLTWAGIAGYIVLGKGCLARNKLMTFLVSFALMAFGSFMTHHGLYVHKPLHIAWGRVPATVATVLVTVIGLATAPELKQAWQMYHKAKALTQSRLDQYHVDVKVKKSLFGKERGVA